MHALKTLDTAVTVLALRVDTTATAVHDLVAVGYQTPLLLKSAIAREKDNHTVEVYTQSHRLVFHKWQYKWLAAKRIVHVAPSIIAVHGNRSTVPAWQPEIRVRQARKANCNGSIVRILQSCDQNLKVEPTAAVGSALALHMRGKERQRRHKRCIWAILERAYKGRLGWIGLLHRALEAVCCVICKRHWWRRHQSKMVLL